MALKFAVLVIALLCPLWGTAAGAPAAPAPHVSLEGPVLTFDFPGVEVGVAEYEEGPTGATVILFRKPVLAVVDVRGGAPGTVNTDALRLGADDPIVDAITLAGGSAYGLSVATGVANALKERNADSGNWKNIAVVPGAIIFDLGGRRYNAVTPDERLGRAALGAVRAGSVALGARGAGRFAMQGTYLGDVQHSGQGAAFRQVGEVKVLVVTVVNALGSIVDRNGRLLRCSHPGAGACDAIAERIDAHLEALGASKVAAAHSVADPSVEADAHAEHAEGHGLTANTTITVVVTNQTLPPWALQRLAVQVHNSMSRAIQPFGTQFDGDTLFAVSTGEINSPTLNKVDLGTLASETAWDAILASAPVLPESTAQPAAAPQAAVPRTDIPPPSAAQLEACVGRYEFAPGAIGEIRRAAAGLEVQVIERGSLYLPANRWVPLTALGPDEFELATPRADRLRFDRGTRGRIIGLTINPGAWPVHARRL